MAQEAEISFLSVGSQLQQSGESKATMKHKRPRTEQSRGKGRGKGRHYRHPDAGRLAQVSVSGVATSKCGMMAEHREAGFTVQVSVRASVNACSKTS